MKGCQCPFVCKRKRTKIFRKRKKEKRDFEPAILKVILSNLGWKVIVSADFID